MNKIETTHFYDDKRYRYFQFGHTCKNRKKTLNELIRCDCKVRFSRVTNSWYRPIEKFSKKLEFYLYKRLGRFNKLSSTIRKTLLNE